jgi:hypothetical protein
VKRTILSSSGGAGVHTHPESDVTSLTTDLGAKAVKLTVTAVKTAAYTAAANEFVPVDTTVRQRRHHLPDRARGRHPGRREACGAGRHEPGDVRARRVGRDQRGRRCHLGHLLTVLNQAVVFQYRATASAIWYATGDDIPLSQLDLRFAPIASPTFTGTVSGVTKTHVGLSNVDNTSDANKPVSTATQTALDAKSGLVSAYQPGDHGLLAWTYDPQGTINSTQLTAGTIYFSAVVLRTAQTVSKLWTGVVTAAATATAGANWLGLYSAAGSKIADVAADTVFTTNGARSATLGTPQALSAGTYLIAQVAAASTMPFLGRNSGLGALINANLSTTGYRFFVNGTGQTTLPASITLASNSTTGAQSFWAALS